MSASLAPGTVFPRLRRAALVAAVAGVVACVVGAVMMPEQFLRSYLFAFVFWTGAALGCVAILMINYVTGGAWGAVIRRPLESGAGTLPLMALLFVPVALGVHRLYEWAQPDLVAHDALLQHKAPYLNVPFFLARAALYFAAWILVARALVRWSHAQDETWDPLPTERLELVSRGGLLLLGLTMTFAAVDWIMSLQPHWVSTIFGVIFMGGSVLSAFALVIPVTAALARQWPASGVVKPEHFHDLGKLLLAFVMLWAYFGFAQFLITWSGNLPEEIPWYVERLHGGWQWIALALVVFHFALPFVVLLSRDVTRKARRLAAVGLALLCMRAFDVYWLVMPAFGGGLAVHWLDVAAILGVGGLWLAVYVRRLESAPLLPLHDSAFAEEA